MFVNKVSTSHKQSCLYPRSFLPKFPCPFPSRFPFPAFSVGPFCLYKTTTTIYLNCTCECFSVNITDESLLSTGVVYSERYNSPRTSRTNACKRKKKYHRLKYHILKPNGSALRTHCLAKRVHFHKRQSRHMLWPTAPVSRITHHLGMCKWVELNSHSGPHLQPTNPSCETKSGTESLGLLYLYVYYIACLYLIKKTCIIL